MLKPNDARSERAYRTLLYYQQQHPDRFEETENAIGDLLTDLRHLCDDYNVDLADRLRFAEECYAEEIEEDAETEDDGEVAESHIDYRAGLKITNEHGPGPTIVMPDERANHAG